MVAKRPLLVQRFFVTCLAQFISLYNWICVASTKKAPRPELFGCTLNQHNAAHIRNVRPVLGPTFLAKAAHASRCFVPDYNGAGGFGLGASSWGAQDPFRYCAYPDPRRAASRPCRAPACRVPARWR